MFTEVNPAAKNCLHLASIAEHPPSLTTKYKSHSSGCYFLAKSKTDALYRNYIENKVTINFIY